MIAIKIALFQATIELCSTHANDVSALKVLFSSLILIAKLFYSLNFQVSHLLHALLVDSSDPASNFLYRSNFTDG